MHIEKIEMILNWKSAFVQLRGGEKTQTLSYNQSFVLLCNFSQLCKEKFINQNVRTLSFCCSTFGLCQLILALKKMSHTQGTKCISVRVKLMTAQVE